MGFYLRKSFRAGPIRFNLSKSGLGISAGVKGSRIGTGPRGNYVHAGRHGLYYRKNLSSGNSTRNTNAGSIGKDGEGCALLLLTVLSAIFGIWLCMWLFDNPIVFFAGAVLAGSVALSLWTFRQRRKKALENYKKLLDDTFVATATSPLASALMVVNKQRDELLKISEHTHTREQIETNVYLAVLDRILDDGFITKEEAATISAAEQTLGISQDVQHQTKKEIFAAAYGEAIQDREITKSELGKLRNFVAELRIPQEKVQRELDIVNEILETQNLCLPFAPIPAEKLAAPIQKNEHAFYQCPAKVLSKRKAKDSPTGYEYTAKRDGMMILTNKRIFVVGDGTTNIRLSDIENVDVDIDEGVIEISKTRSTRPIVLKTSSPIYTGRAIDLLVNAEAGGITR